MACGYQAGGTGLDGRRSPVSAGVPVGLDQISQVSKVFEVLLVSEFWLY
jgi:hypothetical protein